MFFSRSSLILAVAAPQAVMSQLTVSQTDVQDMMTALCSIYETHKVLPPATAGNIIINPATQNSLADAEANCNSNGNAHDGAYATADANGAYTADANGQTYPTPRPQDFGGGYIGCVWDAAADAGHKCKAAATVTAEQFQRLLDRGCQGYSITLQTGGVAATDEAANVALADTECAKSYPLDHAQWTEEERIDDGNAAMTTYNIGGALNVVGAGVKGAGVSLKAKSPAATCLVQKEYLQDNADRGKYTADSVCKPHMMKSPCKKKTVAANGNTLANPCEAKTVTIDNSQPCIKVKIPADTAATGVFADADGNVLCVPATNRRSTSATLAPAGTSGSSGGSSGDPTPAPAASSAPAREAVVSAVFAALIFVSSSIM